MHFHYGPKEDFLGIIGHLDTVPVNQDNWDFDAYSGEIIDGFITGRGAQDDKGPTFAAYWATKIIKDLNLPISKGIRLIFGTQEEGGDWSDIDYYFTQEAMPKVSFTPDAYFPLVFAEKGIVRIKIFGKTNHETPFSLTNNDSVINAVPDNVTFNFKGNTTQYKGTSYHGAMILKTDLDSAIYKALGDIQPQVKSKLIDFINDKFLDDPKAQKINLAYQTELEGDLTCNFGLINIKENGEFSLGLDIRFPSHDDWSAEAIRKHIETEMKEFSDDIKVEIINEKDPIFAHPESDLVQTLENAYRSFTGESKEESPLITTGGGTYARVIPNCVAFGGIFPHDENTMHQANEKFNVDSMMKTVMIYIDAIYNLVK